jgi:hypothetical protein
MEVKVSDSFDLFSGSGLQSFLCGSDCHLLEETFVENDSKWRQINNSNIKSKTKSSEYEYDESWLRCLCREGKNNTIFSIFLLFVEKANCSDSDPNHTH